VIAKDLVGCQRGSLSSFSDNLVIPDIIGSGVLDLQRSTGCHLHP
jgi:hypothetical protein